MGITEILRMFWLYSATRYKKLWLHSKHSTNCWTYLIIAAHNCHTCMKLYFFYSRSSHWLVVPKPGWPQASRTGLSMKFLESDKFGNQHFTFDHSASYQTIQKRFFHAVDSFNPEFIIVRVWFKNTVFMIKYITGCSNLICTKKKRLLGHQKCTFKS